MLSNFLFRVSGLIGTFTIKSRELECIEYIRETVGKHKVLMLVSGGVDSTVCAALLRKALTPEQVIAFHIDNGFMRKNESALVEKSLNNIGLNMKSKFYCQLEAHVICSFHYSHQCFIAILQCNNNDCCVA